MKLLSKIFLFIVVWFATFFMSALIAAFIPTDMFGEVYQAIIGDFLLLVLPVICGVLAVSVKSNIEKKDICKQENKEQPMKRPTSVRRSTPPISAAVPSMKPDTASRPLRTTSYQTPRSGQDTGKLNQQLASAAICEAKFHVKNINESETAFFFTFHFKKLKETIEELIVLNEKKKVYMYPPPRQELQKIESNMEATINDLITRAVDTVPGYGAVWAEQVNGRLDEIEADEFISGYMTEKNREYLANARKRAETARNSRLQSAPAGQLVSCVNQVSRPKTEIDIEQIIRAENEWRREQMGISLVEAELQKVDGMDGYAFEQWCAKLLGKSGFTDVDTTCHSGDQGVDVLATLDGVRYAIQCKCYSSNLGNKPVQEVYAGRAIYNCQIGSVMTNRYFTSGAKKLADVTGVFLWDRDWILSLLEELGDDEFPL